ncbi:MAG: TerB family tellurite resistance protein [Spirochaetaceae bacterium]|nr:TerB family tellurite resistance protein [Myxococcales bacterium]MCB9723570.1 TerB family tellurite resistance protein [Spirochaetaceae bacterium]HPG25326.1 TerB family tellurite resistance protein [Myxococcota bacterium]
MFDRLDRRDRLRLVEFVCSFAWADLEIQPEERVFIARLIRRLDLDAEEDRQVQQWLERPPRIDDLDPTSIPPAHRRLFVEAISGLIEADGEISAEERDSFEIFQQLLID